MLWRAFAFFVLAIPAQSRPGCRIPNYKFDPPVSSQAAPLDAADADACQALCQAQTDCKYWTFWAKDAPKSCWLEKAGAAPIFTQGAICGQKECSDNPTACSEVAPSNWPHSFTAARESHTAWAGGFQPVPLQCWPVDNNRTAQTCADNTVVQDLATGWPGQCEYLNPVTGAAYDTQEKCKNTCTSDVHCASWQYTKDGKCFQGVGTHCYRRSGPNFNAGFEPAASQRIVHGEARTLFNFVGYSLPEASTTNLFSMGYWSEDPANLTTANFEAAAKACEELCKSVILCTWWQLSKVNGCWIEDPKSPGKVAMPYPVVSSTLKADATIFRGGMIQHICAPKPTEAPATTPVPVAATKEEKPEEKAGFPWWGIALIVVGVLALLSFLAAYCLMGQSAPKSKKKRAAKLTPIVEPEPPAPAPVPVQTVTYEVPMFQQYMPQPQLVQPVMEVRQMQQPVMTAMAAPQPVQSTIIQPQIATAPARTVVGQNPMLQGSLFRALDTNGDGVVTRAEFENVMRGY